MKKLLALLLCLLLILGLAACGQGGEPVETEPESAREQDDGEPARQSTDSGRVEQNFTTPELAIQHLVTSLRNSDLMGALGACAIESPAESFDAAAMIERIEVFMLPNYQLATSRYKLYQEMNRIQVMQDRTGQIKMLVLSLVMPDDVLSDIANMTPVQLSAADYSVERYLDAWNPQALGTLEVLDMGYVMPELQRRESHQTNAKRTAAIYGAEELEEWLVHLRCDGREFATGMQLLRYGDYWRVYSLQGNLVGQNAMGMAMPIGGASDFQSILTGGDYTPPSGSRDEEQSRSDSGYDYGYIGLIAPDNAKGTAFARGFSEAAEYAGVELFFHLTDNDIAGQISMIENMVVQGVDMILLFPEMGDPYALIPVVQVCADAGVGVILVDGGIPDLTPGEDYTCLVYLESYGPGEGAIYLMEIALEFLMGSQLSAEIHL